jgi:hypothetical protein
VLGCLLRPACSGRLDTFCWQPATRPPALPPPHLAQVAEQRQAEGAAAQEQLLAQQQRQKAGLRLGQWLSRVGRGLKAARDLGQWQAPDGMKHASPRVIEFS